MNQDVKNRWIKALRSGDYDQGRTVLRKDNNYCCLGVLCDLYLEDHNKGWRVEEVDHEGWHLEEINHDGFYLEEMYNKTIDYYCDDEDEMLPQTVQKWAGLEESDPRIADETGDLFGISYYNDQLNMPFNQIADLIEEAL